MGAQTKPDASSGAGEEEAGGQPAPPPKNHVTVTEADSPHKLSRILHPESRIKTSLLSAHPMPYQCCTPSAPHSSPQTGSSKGMPTLRPTTTISLLKLGDDLSEEVSPLAQVGQSYRKVNQRCWPPTRSGAQ